MSVNARVVAILNLNAGTAKEKGAKALRETLEAAFVSMGLTAELLLVQGSRKVRKQVRRAKTRVKKGELDLIAVGGGDGTVRTAACVLAGTDIPLAVLPLGTMNHFAKDLGIPLDLEGAVELMNKRHVQGVDVGQVNDEVFVNNSSIGMYPFMVADRERRIDKGTGELTARALALLRTVRRFPLRRLVLSSKTKELQRQTPCLFVGNNKYDMNFLSQGRKQLKEGKLYFYVAKPRRVTAFLWFAVRAGLGLAERVRDFDLIEASSAKVKSRVSRLPVALDGKVLLMSTPLKYRSRSGALRVVTPAATK